MNASVINRFKATLKSGGFKAGMSAKQFMAANPRGADNAAKFIESNRDAIVDAIVKRVSR
jgi:hypothetical protein